MASSSEALRDLLESMALELDECVHALLESIPQPEEQPFRDGFVFRHRDKTILALMVLKAVKIASNNNAAVALIRAGFVQETYALCRMINEACEDIIFMAVPLGENSRASKDQQRLLRECFQEELENPNDPLSSTKRDRLPRKKIHTVLSRMRGAETKDPRLHDAVGRTLSQAFSGFVHGSYVHIMELFGGPERRFHTRGLLGTPRIDECERNHVNYLYRSIMAVEAVALRAKQLDIAKRLESMASELMKQTGSTIPRRDQ